MCAWPQKQNIPLVSTRLLWMPHPELQQYLMCTLITLHLLGLSLYLAHAAPDESSKTCRVHCSWKRKTFAPCRRYTSGSTGRPKGVLHTTGGYMLTAATTTKYAFDMRPGDIYWCFCLAPRLHCPHCTWLYPHTMSAVVGAGWKEGMLPEGLSFGAWAPLMVAGVSWPALS